MSADAYKDRHRPKSSISRAGRLIFSSGGSRDAAPPTPTMLPRFMGRGLVATAVVCVLLAGGAGEKSARAGDAPAELPRLVLDSGKADVDPPDADAYRFQIHGAPSATNVTTRARAAPIRCR